MRSFRFIPIYYLITVTKRQIEHKNTKIKIEKNGEGKRNILKIEGTFQGKKGNEKFSLRNCS